MHSMITAMSTRGNMAILWDSGKSCFWIIIMLLPRERLWYRAAQGGFWVMMPVTCLKSHIMKIGDRGSSRLMTCPGRHTMLQRSHLKLTSLSTPQPAQHLGEVQAKPSISSGQSHLGQLISLVIKRFLVFQINRFKLAIIH